MPADKPGRSKINAEYRDPAVRSASWTRTSWLQAMRACIPCPRSSGALSPLAQRATFPPMRWNSSGPARSYDQDQYAGEKQDQLSPRLWARPGAHDADGRPQIFPESTVRRRGHGSAGDQRRSHGDAMAERIQRGSQDTALMYRLCELGARGSSCPRPQTRPAGRSTGRSTGKVVAIRGRVDPRCSGGCRHACDLLRGSDTRVLLHVIARCAIRWPNYRL
jgi:hypothetical protein